MKKLLGIVILGLLWANISFAKDHKPNNFDAFVWSDGKKLKIVENLINIISINCNYKLGTRLGKLEIDQCLVVNEQR